MKKKEIKISNEEMMELMGLKRTSNSDDDSDKTAIDLAIDKYSKEELAAKKAERPNEPTTDEVTPNDMEDATKADSAEEQPSAPPIQRRVSNKQRKLSLEEYRQVRLCEWLSVIAISGHALLPNKRTISVSYAEWQTTSQLTRKDHREGVGLHYGQCQHLLLSLENIIDHISH